MSGEAVVLVGSGWLLMVFGLACGVGRILRNATRRYRPPES